MSEDERVVVAVEIPAPPMEVYRYWTEPDRCRRWMGRTVRLDPTPRGEFFVEMNDGFAAQGTFIALDPGRRVEFSWGWVPGAGEAIPGLDPQPADT